MGVRLSSLSAIKQRLALVVVFQPRQCVHLAAVETSNECLFALNFSEVLPALELVLVDWGPHASCPDAPFHLTALGHFKTVERIAV